MYCNSISGNGNSPFSSPALIGEIKFLSCVNDLYIEPMATFTAWAKISLDISAMQIKVSRLGEILAQ